MLNNILDVIRNHSKDRYPIEEVVARLAVGELVLNKLQEVQVEVPLSFSNAISEMRNEVNYRTRDIQLAKLEELTKMKQRLEDKVKTPETKLAEMDSLIAELKTKLGLSTQAASATNNS